MTMESVFNNEKLLKNILKHVLYPKSTAPIKAIVDRSDVGNLRLVNKLWLGCVGDIIYKNRNPLLCSELNGENSVSGTNYCKENGKALNKINSILRNPVGRSKSYQMPTFALRFLPDFFREENYEDFAECFEKHGHGITHLDLIFPRRSSMTMTLSPFTLPNLIRLAVKFTNQCVSETANVSNVNRFPAQMVYPLQTVLNATSELLQLEFKLIPSETLIPNGFDFLRLPTTIKFLLLDCPLKNQDLQILLKNDLPNLRHLRLCGSNKPYAEGLIFQILNKYGTCLNSLCLKMAYYRDHKRNATLFRMPIMEKLDTLTTSSTWELEENTDEQMEWESCLPELRNMKLSSQTEAMFAKWTKNSIYESVNLLSVSLINTNDYDATGNLQLQDLPLTINRQKMQALHMAFPNVTILDITMCGTMTCGIKYLFMEMRNLEHFAVNLTGSRPNQLESSHWDALLIGVPVEKAASLKNDRDYWKNLDLVHDEKHPSIRMLSELESFRLIEKFDESTASVTVDSPELENSLISDLSFVFGFLKMQNLHHLLLSGQFKASASIAEQWKQEKGTEILYK